MAIITTDDGKQWKFVGYGSLSPGSYYLAPNGEMRQATVNSEPGWVLLRPILKEYVYGRIRLRETGEVRQVQPREWGFIVGAPQPWTALVPSTVAYPILEPIAIEPKEAP